MARPGLALGKRVDEVVGETLGSPGFAQGMHGAMGTSQSARKAFADGMGRSLSALNTPNRADVAVLGDVRRTSRPA